MSERINNVLGQMKKRGLSQILLCDPTSIFYLTKVLNYPFERLYALIIRDDGQLTMVANKLFNVGKVDFEVVWYDDADDQISLLADLVNKEETLGVDKDFSAKFLLPLLEKCEGMKAVVASDCVDEVRAIKGEDEIILMRKASQINDIVMEKSSKFIKEGMKEKEVAEYITNQYLVEGADGNSFSPIVSFGANAADPHHSPDDTILKAGDVVLLDIGCIKDGYCSDMTRTFFCKEASEHQKEIHDLVRQANELAESIIKPGVKLADIDKTARDLITEKGYGPNFNHRLGHFIGLTEHEKGDVSSANDSLTKPGMIFSIEPGIYLEDDLGVRVEDLVLVTEDGCEVLNKVDKHWQIIG